MTISSIIEWVNTNKEWLFSGVGLLVLTGLFSWLRPLTRKSRHQGISIDTPNSGSEANVSSIEQRKRTAQIPTTTQTLEIVFGKSDGLPPLIFKNVTGAFVEVRVAWKVIDLKEFLYSGDQGHPLDEPTTLLLIRLRQHLERLTIENARKQRSDIGHKVLKEVASIFSDRGIKLESVDIGAIIDPAINCWT